MDLELVRYGSIPTKGTFGEFSMSGLRFFTVEREWLDNKPGISCVPAGEYKLVPHSSRKYPETWALVNHDLGVYHWHDSKAIRYGILLHKANYASELEGCIAIGKYLGVVQDERKTLHWSVTSSGHAMAYVLALLAADSEHTLTIKYAEHP